MILSNQTAKPFVLYWEDALSVKQVATHFNMTERTCSNLAAGLRRRGIPLKKMKNTGGHGKPAYCLTKSDVQDLKLLVEKNAGAREVQEKYRGTKP